MTGVLIRGEKESETTGKTPYEDTIKKKKKVAIYKSRREVLEETKFTS